MSSVLNDAKRTAIAEKLADMSVVQNTIIQNERQLLQSCGDGKVRKRLENILEDDEKNLEIIQTAITQYGIQAEPHNKTQQMIEQAQQAQQSDLSLYEKFAQHELLKHGQVMTGLVIHKAGQKVGADVEAAIAPLNTVNFENRAHQEQLKGLLEYLGTSELTGEEPDQGVWGRVRDTLSAMTGALGSATTQATDDDNADVNTLIFMDHQKAKTLMREIEQADNREQAQTFFNQLYSDLIVHSKAEEEAVYPKVKSFYGQDDIQELYQEQDEMETVLNELKAMDPTSNEFITKLQRLKAMVGDHTRQEESTMFASMRKNLSSDQRDQMGEQFKAAKQRLQKQMAS